jgi:plastocyanin
MRRRAEGLALATLLLLPVAACGGSASSDAGPVATATVDLPQSYLFSPPNIAVKAGTSVTWKNSDQFSHSVRLLESGQIVGAMKPGETVSFTFAKAGTYRYDCSFHPQNMKGTVTVQ